MSAMNCDKRPKAFGEWAPMIAASAAGLIMLASLGPLFGELPSYLKTIDVSAAQPRPVAVGGTDDRRITGAEYGQILEGLSYRQVAAIVGDPGEEQGSARVGGVSAKAYGWSNDDGSNATIIFREDKMMLKTQAGL